jgi:hypothetical protein
MNDSLTRRLRAARPVAPDPGDHDALFARIVAEPGDPRLADSRHGRSWSPPRRRVLAGGSLGLAGVAAALVVALSGSAAPPAFAITKSGDGSVLVTINRLESLPDANRKLAAMGIHEQITIYMATGAAAVSRPVTCTPTPGANVSGPPLKVLVGKDGTEDIQPGQTAGNTGVGSYHLDRCVVTRHTRSGISGNTGAR